MGARYADLAEVVPLDTDYNRIRLPDKEVVMRVPLVLSVVVLLVVVPWSLAGFPGSDLYLVSVGRGAGAAGSVWYTTVWIHNPGGETATVTLSLLRRGQENTSPEQQIVFVGPGETLKLGDALVELFGAESASGALRLQASAPVVVAARVFNQTGDNLADSQGQFMAGVPAELALELSSSTDIPGITQPEDASFRCNFALVETAGADVTVEATLYDHFGGELASKDYMLRPYEAMQENLSELGEVTVDGGRLHVEVTSGDGRVLALASMVGNGAQSQDPSTLEMELEMASDAGQESTAFFTQVHGPLTASTFEVVATLAVPAGSYVINGKVQARMSSAIATGWSAVCMVSLDGTTVDSTQVGVAINSGSVATIPVAAAGTLDTDGLIELECYTGESELLLIKLIATRVGTLTEQ